MTRPPSAPAILEACFPQGEAALQRHAGWQVQVLNLLRAQGVQPGDRVLILLGALAHETLTVAGGQEAQAVAWLQWSLGSLVEAQARFARAELDAAEPQGRA
jgi:hypothetical protein